MKRLVLGFPPPPAAVERQHEQHCHAPPDVHGADVRGGTCIAFEPFNHLPSITPRSGPHEESFTELNEDFLIVQDVDVDVYGVVAKSEAYVGTYGNFRRTAAKFAGYKYCRSALSVGRSDTLRHPDLVPVLERTSICKHGGNGVDLNGWIFCGRRSELGIKDKLRYLEPITRHHSVVQLKATVHYICAEPMIMKPAAIHFLGHSLNY
ncbi:hypothetical protein GGX14DRAFT_658474 [Mycena pura]|uniref:Uncharacterized protein n=1 Tax=Mycena pura TaxID=153505 RepID=A0AAD6YM95_9AGAR|nr:hypothetical protein GGX14DRAFT_658474 [Mycena pura]